MKRAIVTTLAAAALAGTLVLPMGSIEAASGNPVPMTITVDGLEANDEAVLRIGIDDGSLELTGQALYEYTVKAVSGAAEGLEINPTLEDGGYLLVVEAPEEYFREPRGYLFRVNQGVVVNPAGHSIEFKLIPPEARDYEPYRGPMTVPSTSTTLPPPGTGEVTYRVEAVVLLSAPPKLPERISGWDLAKPLAAALGPLAIVGAVIFVIVRTIVRVRARGRGG